MDLLHLVDRLEELAATAQKMPIGSRAIVDRRRLLDIVDQMRVSIPQEVREAQELMARRDAARLEAEEEARLVIARAEERAARMVEQHELAIAARRRGEELMRQAEARIEERMQQANIDMEERIAESRRLAEQQMAAADEYARELLRRLERQLQAFVRSVQSGIAQLETPPEEARPAVEAAREQRAEQTSEATPGGRAAAEPPQQPPAQPGAAVQSAPANVEQQAPVVGGPEGTQAQASAGQSVMPLPSGSPRAGRPGGPDALPNLLERQRAQPAAQPSQPAPRPDAQAGVIDDFAMPSLDDESSAAAEGARGPSARDDVPGGRYPP